MMVTTVGNMKIKALLMCFTIVLAGCEYKPLTPQQAEGIQKACADLGLASNAERGSMGVTKVSCYPHQGYK